MSDKASFDLPCNSTNNHSLSYSKGDNEAQCTFEDLGMCEIAQTGLEKCKFAQTTFLSLFKFAKMFPKCVKELVQIYKTLPKHGQCFAKHYIILPVCCQENAQTLLDCKLMHI